MMCFGMMCVLIYIYIYACLHVLRVICESVVAFFLVLPGNTGCNLVGFLPRNCTNYDLCEVCENIYPPVHDPIHVFLKLRKPCPKAGIRHGQRVALLKRTIYQPEVEDQMSREERRKE